MDRQRLLEDEEHRLDLETFHRNDDITYQAKEQDELRAFRSGIELLKQQYDNFEYFKLTQWGSEITYTRDMILAGKGKNLYLAMWGMFGNNLDIQQIGHNTHRIFFAGKEEIVDAEVRFL